MKEKERKGREERRKKNGTSAESTKSGEVLPSEAPYETDNQREERKRLLRRGSKNISRAFLLLRDAERTTEEKEPTAETAQVGFRDSRVRSRERSKFSRREGER